MAVAVVPAARVAWAAATAAVATAAVGQAVVRVACARGADASDTRVKTIWQRNINWRVVRV